MRNYFSLTKVFLKNIYKGRSSHSRNRFFFRLLVWFTILFILIPFFLICGIFIYDTTLQLADINYESVGLQMMCYLILVFTFIFSFSALLNEFYFSEDIERLFPLPIRPVEIIFAKFSACFFIENGIQIILVLISIFSYLLALHLPLSNILFAFIPILTLPVIPMVYSSLICLILMYFSKFIKNKERVRKASSLLVVALFLIFIFFVYGLKDFDFSLYLENFANGDHKILEIMNFIFPHVNLFIDTLTNRNIFSLLFYLFFNLLFLGGFYFLADALYLKGVIGLSSRDTSTHKKRGGERFVQHSVFYSYLLKEVRILTRTPSFFINCFLINLLWPIFVYALYKIFSVRYSLLDMKSLVLSGDSFIRVLLLVVVCGISILLPAASAISSSSFSREGKHFSFIKYIPISYPLQWFVKYSVSFLISFSSITLYGIIFYLFLGLDISTIVLYLFISSLAVSLISLIGVYVDSIQPKIIWDDENNALRENYNTFIAMGISLFFFGMICGGAYFYLYRVLGDSFLTIYLFILVVLVLSNLFFLILSLTSGKRNLILQEEV